MSFCATEKNKVKELYELAVNRLNNDHEKCFYGRNDTLLLISAQYPGVWLEHVYDSIIYAKLFPEKLYIAKNTLNLFISLQEKGQLPCYVWDKARVSVPEESIGYSEIQECVSFAKLCLEYYYLSHDLMFLRKCYSSAAKWILWLESNRMTLKKGLIEMFVGYDTGHDNSGRLSGMSEPGYYRVDNVLQNASICPPNDSVAPIIAVDMNCNYYASLISIAKMAKILNRLNEEEIYLKKAKDVKHRLFAECYDSNDKFFYDVDKNGNKRKYLSSQILHLFMEKVLDKTEDKNFIDAIYEKHIRNPKEFWTEYPFPSMAINDPSIKNRTPVNCWGYYSQALIALRCTLWMDYYEKNRDFDVVCEKWIKATVNNSDRIHFGQEIDPISGETTMWSDFYSSCMLFFIYASRRLKLV